MTDAESTGPDGQSGGTASDGDGVIAFEPPIEPGAPSLENALFVILGVAVALGVVLRLIELFG